jgi:probable rRNA maturation factor
MTSLHVLIYVESRYKVDRSRMKKTIAETLTANSVTTPVEVSVAIVGDRKMKGLNQKYRNLDKTTNVLSFPQQEGEKSIVQGDIARLGDIVLSYPQVVRESARDDMLIDEKIDQLLQHSMLHLLGIHHQ